MNAWSSFHRVALIGYLAFQACFAVAQDDHSMIGTHSVIYQPGQIGGVLQSCTLVFRAVQSDFAYQKGGLTLIVGNIGVQRFGGKLMMNIKIGTREIEVPGSLYTRPFFAYLQTDNATTANCRFESMDGEEGFRLLAISLDPTSSKLLLEMLETGKVTIGFNRIKGGLDVLVPLDLTVYDSDYSESGIVTRKRSNMAITQFLNGYKTILEQTISKSPK